MKTFKYFKIFFIFLVLVTTMYGNASEAKDYIPLLSKDKEWGFIEYYPYRHFYQQFEYHRLACGNQKRIDDKEYTEICKYTSFLKPDNAEVIAYMREEEGKVYVRYPKEIGRHFFNFFWQDFEAYDSPKFNPDFGNEHLIYDFGMEAGDVIELEGGMIYEEPATLKCVETGTVNFDGIERKYLKFDKDVNLTCLFWMNFEYIIEGIGPVGNCNFTMPFRSDPTSSLISSFTSIRLLYQRELPTKEDNESEIQGKMLYKPPYFEIYGICDPSVYLWKSNQNQEVPSAENHKGTDVNIRYDSGGNIYCGEEPLKTVTEYNMIGQEIATHSPADNRFKVSLGHRGKVAKVETENYCRYFTNDFWD